MVHTPFYHYTPTSFDYKMSLPEGAIYTWNHLDVNCKTTCQLTVLYQKVLYEIRTFWKLQFPVEFYKMSLPEGAIYPWNLLGVNVKPTYLLT